MKEILLGFLNIKIISISVRFFLSEIKRFMNAKQNLKLSLVEINMYLT